MKSRGSIGILGIMTCEAEGMPPFAEASYYARLCEHGRQAGLFVYVFSPVRADPVSRTVSGYRYDASRGRWYRGTFPLPDLIYNRSFGREPHQYGRHRQAVRELLNVKPIPFMGRTLGNKWSVHQALRRYAEYRPHLPPTQPYSRRLLLRRLGDPDGIILKPAGGMHGKGVLHVARLAAGGFRLRGRDAGNREVALTFEDPRSLMERIERIVAGAPYLLQRYLRLTTAGGEAFDVRALTQKDGTGRWVVTGMAVRRGQSGSLTSNLHGGGQPASAASFLTEQYGRAAAARIEAELHTLARSIPDTLERHFGRLAELGIDLGVDQAGRVWIIEVNSMPGRNAFRESDADGAGIRAETNPIAYARFLLNGTAAVTPLRAHAVHSGIPEPAGGHSPARP